MTTSSPIVFCTDEFSKRLNVFVKDDDTVLDMLEMHNRYHVALGLASLQNPDEFPSWLKDMRVSYDIDTSKLCYNPDTFVKILVTELGISEEIAQSFNDCEEEYMTELGMM